ncbi:MAG: STAS domain-containing protein [Pseudomonadota bacterium]|nr:STAS domain-containing protein [Pseudomonadota bacterium]
MSSKTDQTEHHEAIVLSRDGAGPIRVRGAMTFGSATAGIQAFNPYCTEGTDPELQMDLSQVARMDSAGLALLLQWKRMAHSAGRTIRFNGLPQQAQNLATVFAVDALIGTDNAN